MNRTELLTQYANAHAELTAALDELEPLGEAFIHYRPRPEAWSVQEIVIHLVDSEVHGYQRLRRLAAEPGSTVMVYDQDAWVAAMPYHDLSLADHVELFRLLRKVSYALVQRLPESVWGHSVTHSATGAYSMSRWLEQFAEHVPGHIAQMRRNLAAWEAAGRPQ